MQLTMDNKKKIFPSISRLRRRDYVLWQLLFCIGYLALFALNFATFGILGHVLFMSGLMYAFIILEIYLTARRLQDCNITGWLSLLLYFRVFIIPGVLFLCIYPGTKGVNKFGADPCENTSASNTTKKDFPETSP